MRAIDDFTSEKIPVVPEGLVFTHDGMPGFKRVKKGKGFAYFRPDGSLMKDPKILQRIRSLAIPPAYHSVWICAKANGHLQATGLDFRGRKQYRYHATWHEWSGGQKFAHLGDFLKALPHIRASVRKSLDAEELSRERIISAVVMLLDLTGYRIGNSKYATENKSYGLTTLLSKHVKSTQEGWQLHFRGKSGMEHDTVIDHAALGPLISELQELPGQHLFRYEDANGQWHDLGTSEVNAWLKSVGGGDFTAKQFRTWRASLLCAKELGKLPPAETKTGRIRDRNAAIRYTAGLLHHRPATCRKYYIHPAIFEAYKTGELHRLMKSRPPQPIKFLKADERRVLQLLVREIQKKNS